MTSADKWTETLTNASNRFAALPCWKHVKGPAINDVPVLAARLLIEAEEAARREEREACAKIVALANGPGRGEFIVPLCKAIRARNTEKSDDQKAR